MGFAGGRLESNPRHSSTFKITSAMTFFLTMKLSGLQQLLVQFTVALPAYNANIKKPLGNGPGSLTNVPMSFQKNFNVAPSAGVFSVSEVFYERSDKLSRKQLI